jgi:hypothetical protein
LASHFIGQHLLSHACQKPAVMIELSQRNPNHLMLALHQVAHASAGSLAQQNRKRIGFVITKP